MRIYGDISKLSPPPSTGEGEGGGVQFNIFMLRDALVGHGGLDSFDFFYVEGDRKLGLSQDLGIIYWIVEKLSEVSSCDGPDIEVILIL